jgi:hypothetical protein
MFDRRLGIWEYHSGGKEMAGCGVSSYTMRQGYTYGQGMVMADENTG